MDHPYYRAYVRTDDKKHCQRKLTDKVVVNITNWCDDLLGKAFVLHVGDRVSILCCNRTGSDSSAAKRSAIAGVLRVHGDDQMLTSPYE